MKLISNTGYGDVLRTKHIPDYEYRYLRDKFDEFLKKPLEKWMFVPCDDNGNVLEEPKNYKEWCEKKMNTPYDLDINKYEIYQQAKEACIFSDNLLSLIEVEKLIFKNKTIEFYINYYYEKTGSYMETNKQLF